MSIFKQLFTGIDGITHDLGRWSWAGSFLAVVGVAAGNVWHGIAVDLQVLATALGTVAGVHGAALWAKRDTEPTEPKQ